MNRIGNAVGQQAVPLGGRTNQFGAGYITLRDTQKGWLPDSDPRTYMQEDIFLQPPEAHGQNVNPFPEYVPESTDKSLQENFNLMDPKISQNKYIQDLQSYRSGIEHTVYQPPTVVRSEGQLDNHEIISKGKERSGGTITSVTPAALTTKIEAVSKLASEVQGGTPEEMENLRTRVVSLLNNINASRKDDAEEAKSSPNPDYKRKQLPCKRCKKTLGRHCDLKYTGLLLYYPSHPANFPTENT